MKPFRPLQEPRPVEQSSTTIKRRHLVVGAGAAAAAVVATQALRSDPVVLAPAAVADAAVAGNGYQLTPHVLRYYETAKV